MVHAQSIRHGEYSGAASIPQEVAISKGSSWKHNVSRQAWKLFKRRQVMWNVPMKTFNYVDASSGDQLAISYISPCDLMEYLITHHPGVLVGGFQSSPERARHLDAFWAAFRLQNNYHVVYEEHNDHLPTVIPLAFHGDEGRGKRRGNTAVVSCGAVIGTQSVVNSRKRSFGDCDCNPPASLKQKFGGVTQRLSTQRKNLLRVQSTTMKGHSMLHRWPLFIIPSDIHHAHPNAMIQLLEIIAKDFKQLFYDGVTVSGRTFNFAVIAAKGDLKWFAKIALQRSWENQGRIRDIACCHECLGGQVGTPWDDMVSDRPNWSNTRFLARPWTDPPCVLAIPFCRLAPERMFKRDPFHLTKVGIYRDVVGSIVCFLAMKDYFGSVGTFDSKLCTAHSAFKLYCKTVKKNPALRTFTRRLFMLPRFDSFPWANVKGSDCMLMMEWLAVQLTGCINAPEDASHIPTLRLMKAVCKAGKKVFTDLNGHSWWMWRDCSTVLFQDLHGFIRGYIALANVLLNDVCAFAIKPKLHLLRHASLEVDELLSAGDECMLNYNCHNCEMDEDLIGRVCRLSRRLDSRCIGERVLGCSMLKAGILYRRFKRFHKL